MYSERQLALSCQRFFFWQLLVRRHSRSFVSRSGVRGRFVGRSWCRIGRGFVRRSLIRWCRIRRSGVGRSGVGRSGVGRSRVRRRSLVPPVSRGRVRRSGVGRSRVRRSWVGRSRIRRSRIRRSRVRSHFHGHWVRWCAVRSVGRRIGSHDHEEEKSQHVHSCRWSG